MAIGLTLTRGVRRTGSDSLKTNFSSRKGSNRGDCGSEAASLCSSVHDSTSGATSFTDRYSSGVVRGIRQKKTLDKLNSKKPTAFGSIRPSTNRPHSQLLSLQHDGPAITHHESPVEPSDASPDHQKPVVHKFTRSGSLRSLRILRKKNMTSSESKSLTIEDSHSKKATFSSILKDSKFSKQVEPQVGVKESEQVLSSAKLCSYEHCSLHGHHHHHDPPCKRFSFLNRRSSKDQKSINPQTRATNKRSVKEKEAKANQIVSKERGKEKEVDFSIEFYAKTRPESSFEPNCSRDDVHLADIMFRVNGDYKKEDLNLLMDDQNSSIVNVDGKNDSFEEKPGFNNEKQMSMWRLIHMVSGLIDKQLQDEKQICFDDNDALNEGKKIQKMFAIKMVREAIENVLLPEEDGSENNQGDDRNEPHQGANDPFITKSDKRKGWNHLKKVILTRRFINELENSKNKLLDPDKRGHVPIEPEPGQRVSLRSQTIREKKNSNEWMLDYALQQVVAGLAPSQKRKVALLVKSFEMITPKLEKEVAI